jgi:hypothetical protein
MAETGKSGMMTEEFGGGSKKFGSLTFASTLRLDWRVEKFIPSRAQH